MLTIPFCRGGPAQPKAGRRIVPPAKFILVILGLLALTACAFRNATIFPPPAAPAQKINDVYVVLLLIDGARPQDIDRLVAEGRLPNIKRLFYDQGARYQNALAVIPTASTPSHQSFVSGLFPGHHGIPNLDWFDRASDYYIDYLKPKDILITPTYMFNFKQIVAGEVATDRPHLIYHDLEGQPTMTVMETAVSGVTHIRPKRPPFVTAFHGKIEKFYEEFDLEAMRLTLEHFRTAEPGDVSRLSYVSFYGMDLVTHFDGIMGTRMRDLYLHHDRFVGELESVLKKRGIWEKTTLVMFSDHGQHALKRVADLPEILKRVGLRPNQVKFADHGLSISNLYFKMGKDWRARPTYQDLKNFPLTPEKRVDLIAAFEKEPDIEWVIAPEGPWKIHLHREGRHALIERRVENGADVFAYKPDPGSDPLEYLNDPEIDSWVKGKKFLDSESWLQATQDKKFPDAVVLLAGLFPDYRAGDLLLFTAEDTQFREKRLAGHGSMLAEDLKIALMFHGPDIQPGVYKSMRSVDLYPTLLSLFGLKPSSPIDGVLRAEILKSGPQAERILTPATKPTMSSPAAFRMNLENKLRAGTLNDEEKKKAKMILYSLEQFEADRQHYAMPGTESKGTGVARQP